MVGPVKPSERAAVCFDGLHADRPSDDVLEMLQVIVRGYETAGVWHLPSGLGHLSYGS